MVGFSTFSERTDPSRLKMGGRGAPIKRRVGGDCFQAENGAFARKKISLVYCLHPNKLSIGSNDIFLVMSISHALSEGISDMKFLIYQLPDEGIPQKETQNFATMNRSLFLAKAMFIAPRFLLKLKSKIVWR